MLNFVAVLEEGSKASSTVDDKSIKNLRPFEKTLVLTDW